MTVHDALATLRASLDVLYHYTSDLANPPGEGRSAAWSSGKAAVRCVEAEIARLEQERDALASDLAEREVQNQELTHSAFTAIGRADVLEAEAARLRGTIEWAIAEQNLGALIRDKQQYEWWVQQIRRRALLAEDGAA